MTKSMIRKYILAFILLFILAGSPFSLSQRAVQQKPNSSGREQIEYYRDEAVIGKAEIQRKYYSEFSHDKKRIEVYEETGYAPDISKKNFINYTSYSRNYFKIDDNENSLWNGKHWSLTDYPLKVHIKKSSSKNFKDLYKTYIDYAFKIWGTADYRIKFKYTDSSSDADIIISFEDNLMEKYDENYLGLTDYEVNKDKQIIRSFVEIGLLKFDNRKISDGEVKSTIIHELGHALGLGHSSNYLDLMYPFINEDSGSELSNVELSTGDMEAIRSVVDLGYKNSSE